MIDVLLKILRTTTLSLAGMVVFTSTALAQSIPIAPIPGPGTIPVDGVTAPDPANPPPLPLLYNTPFTLVIPVVGSRMLNTVNPGDATLVLRLTATITNAWYDACAPYADHADPLTFTSEPRRPVHERTVENCNIAIVYSSLPVVNSLLPQFADDWTAMVDAIDIDLQNNLEHQEAARIGYEAGLAVMNSRLHDGMNQLGDEDGSIYNLQPYADYTDYRPPNSAYRLWFPKFWQPAVVTEGNGLFSVQQFVTPQMEFTAPFLTAHPNLSAPRPDRSYDVGFLGWPRSDYVAQTDEVLHESATLDDVKKMTAELFEDKINSLGLSIAIASAQQGLTLQEFLEVDFLVNAAAFDTAIVIWKEKRRWNAVRPFSSIRYLYGHQTITAWGGPRQGTVTDITGNEWRSYLNVANHPEYPSATASFCAAHATASRLYLDDYSTSPTNPDGNTLDWLVAFDVGSSFVEPGFTPAATRNPLQGDPRSNPQSFELHYATWDDLREDCGLSRFWAGVHFLDAVPAGQAIGDIVGEDSYDFLKPYFEGTADPHY